MKAYYYLSKKRENRKGECPVYCRVAHEEYRADFSTRIFITKSEWEKQGWERIHRNHISDRLNSLLKKVHAIISGCEDENIYSPAEVIGRLRELQRPQVTDISAIATEYLDMVKPTLLVRLRLQKAVSQFQEMLGHSMIRKIVPENIQGFENYLIEKGVSVSTVVKKLQLVKRVFRYAEHKKYIHVNSFALYKFPSIPKPKLIQLEQSELTTLQQKHFAQERLNRVKDLFLFQCYTGLSYADLSVFGRRSIVCLPEITLLKGKREKTGEEYTVPWIPEAAAIADKYNYTLPVISNQRYNSYIKEIADIVGLEKKLTTHAGRKTFAQVMIDKGYSAEAVTRMMGHSSFTMTQKHYARIGDVRVINEALKMAG